MKNPIPSPRFLHTYCVAALLVPNITLCFTERMPLLACLAGIVLPLGAYSLVMSLSRKTGRTVWILFPIVFFAAFQMVPRLSLRRRRDSRRYVPQPRHDKPR